MPATYEPIASTTLGATAGTIDFTSIPGTYTDLVLVLTTGGATAGASMRFRVNSDSGSNYSFTELRGNGSVAASSRDSNGTAGVIGGGNSGSSNAVDNVYTALFQSYSNTNVFKTVLGSSATASREVGRSVSLWRSTSAITSISVSLGGAFPTYNMLSGTVAAIYGIKAA